MHNTEAPELYAAVFGDLAAAESTLHDLQAAGVPYPAIRMGTHTAEELAGTPLAERVASAGQAGRALWSLTLTLDPQWREQALTTLHAAGTLALGRLPAPDNRANDTERGAIAWRHYVFETDAATDAVGEGAGTTGTTGVISSGVFADGALASGNPPVRSQPAGDHRPSDAGQAPTSDTRRPDTSKDRSRPQTELKEP